MHFAPFLFYLELDRVFVMIISTFTLLVWLVMIRIRIIRITNDKNYVQIQKKCISLGYITKLIVLYQAEQTDDFYTPSSV